MICIGGPFHGLDRDDRPADYRQFNNSVDSRHSRSKRYRKRLHLRAQAGDRRAAERLATERQEASAVLVWLGLFPTLQGSTFPVIPGAGTRK